MRFGFVTCVGLGLACIEEIYEVGGELDVVLTLPDEVATEKSGRAYVDSFCLARGIPVCKVEDINSDAAIQAVRAANIDWLFIIGWSQIVQRELLKVPRRGCLGMHPTLLPEGRGRAAIPWAIIKGLTQTGVTLFKLDEGVDTGPVLAQEVIAVSSREDAGTLYEKVKRAHRLLIRRSWRPLFHSTVTAAAQDERRASCWPVRRPEDGRLHAGMSVELADRLVRATTRPYPGAFLETGSSILRIWSGEILTGAREPAGSALRIKFADGVFEATDYDRSSTSH